VGYGAKTTLIHESEKHKMASLNKMTLIGNLGTEPDLRSLPNGTPTATLSVATSRSWKDPNGERQERTDWHRVVLYKGLAELAGKYLHKGLAVYVEGRLRTRKWQDQGGSDHYTTEIVAHDLKMLSKTNSTVLPAGVEQMVSEAVAVNTDIEDDDIPW
jgi:single-strand DNA-binding protein